MSKKGAVPDAWDDEWESLADVRGIALLPLLLTDTDINA